MIGAGCVCIGRADLVQAAFVGENQVVLDAIHLAGVKGLVNLQITIEPKLGGARSWSPWAETVND